VTIIAHRPFHLVPFSSVDAILKIFEDGLAYMQVLRKSSIRQNVFGDGPSFVKRDDWIR
jgi:hypothetical protein